MSGCVPRDDKLGTHEALAPFIPVHATRLGDTKSMLGRASKTDTGATLSGSPRLPAGFQCGPRPVLKSAANGNSLLSLRGERD